MQRSSIIVLTGVLILALDPTLAFAQDGGGWPTTGVPFTRGAGGYLSTFKILLSWFVFLGWVKTTDWVSQDCFRTKMNYSLWNPLVVFPFLLAFLLSWVIPWYWIAFVLMLMAWIAPLVVYIVQRNASVEEYQKVMTGPHLRHMLSVAGSKVGLNISSSRVLDADKGPPVKLIPKGGADEQADQANLLLARQSPGYLTAKEVIADLLDRRGNAMLLNYSATTVAMKYEIDGIWHDLPHKDRLVGDPLLAVLKRIANKNEAERRKKQEGKFGVEYQGAKYTASIVCQGVESGERALVYLHDKKVRFKTFEGLGMRPKLVEQVKQTLSAPQGLILFSALPAGGLSTLFDVGLRESDRYMRDFAAIEEVSAGENEIENVTVHTYDAAAGETPMTKLPNIIRTYPGVYAIRDPFDAQSLGLLLEQIPDDRVIMTSVRAKEAVESV
ncbi:MAG: ATPase, T2SS/T4P/T4SS family [Planctomycetota bacterium]|nr:ATPase, T2SS/T4P/T4SS family [Planctomycetota bacterium]